MPVSNWSTTAASNGSTLGIDIAENCDAANINNALREMMAQLRTKLDAMDVLIGDGSLDATLTALAGLTTAANQLIYSTGVDAFAMTTLSTFARTLIDDGDAATARTTLEAVGFGTPSLTSASGDIPLKLGASTVRLQWKDVTVTSGIGTTAMTFPTAFSSFAKVWVEGTNDETGDSSAYVQRSTITTSGCTLSNAASASQTVTVFAIGV